MKLVPLQLCILMLELADVTDGNTTLDSRRRREVTDSLTTEKPTTPAEETAPVWVYFVAVVIALFIIGSLVFWLVYFLFYLKPSRDKDADTEGRRSSPGAKSSRSSVSRGSKALARQRSSQAFSKGRDSGLAKLESQTKKSRISKVFSIGGKRKKQKEGQTSDYASSGYSQTTSNHSDPIRPGNPDERQIMIVFDSHSSDSGGTSHGSGTLSYMKY